VGADPGRLRIAFSTAAVTGVPVHADCVSAVHEAAALCADLGHEVVEATLAVDSGQIVQAFLTVFSAGGAWDIDHMARITSQTPAPDQFEPLTWASYELARQISALDYMHSITVLQRVARDIGHFLVSYDVWLTPTLAEPPVPLGTFDSPPGNPLQGFVRAVEYCPFTPICNFTGQPAMSVPLYWNADNLPVGTHFIGRFGDEATLFRLAAQLEEARPWAGRRPPVSA
jgi:amidase